MDIELINQNLSEGNVLTKEMFPHLYRLEQSPFIFETKFGLDTLPLESGILLIRGPRQYGKSTWLESQVVETIKNFGKGSAFYLNGDFLSNAEALADALDVLAVSFQKESKVKRIFIDEITSIKDWEIVLKRMVDNGTLENVLVVTTGSKATDLHRGAERLPGRKGKLKRSSYLFTPISYKNFHSICYKILKEKTLNAYIISGGSPIACMELALNGRIPEYIVELARNWVEGEVAKAGRHRSSFLNIMNVLYRCGGSAIGQANLAREAGLANNTVAQGYIELLTDLGCVVPAYPWDHQRELLILRKQCKYHFMNLLVATCYHPAQLRSPDDFELLPADQQAAWYEWVIAQELQRRLSIRGDDFIQPLAFWQSKNHEIDFFDKKEGYIEVKRGKCHQLDFAWFSKQFGENSLTVINKNEFSTEHLRGISLENFLLSD